MAKEASTFKDFEVSIPTNAREIPPLLTQTQWHVYLDRYLQDKPLRNKLIMMITPTPLPQYTLGKLIIQYLHMVRSFAKNTSLIIHCLLMECPR